MRERELVSLEDDGGGGGVGSGAHNNINQQREKKIYKPVSFSLAATGSIVKKVSKGGITGQGRERP